MNTQHNVCDDKVWDCDSNLGLVGWKRQRQPLCHECNPILASFFSNKA